MTLDDVGLVAASAVAVAAVLVIALHRRIVRTPDGRGRGVLVASALVVLVPCLVLIAALLADR